MRAEISSETDSVYEFGEFRLDTAAKTLVCRGEPVALTPKVFDTLQLLVEHAGRLLEKDELMERLWQDRFVEESNLTFNIKMLRRALHDDAQRPQYIETVPRRGYRFIAGVRQVSRAPAHTEPAPVQSVTTGSSRKSIWAIAIALALIASTLALIRSWRQRASGMTASAPILSAPFKSQKLSSAGTMH